MLTNNVYVGKTLLPNTFLIQLIQHLALEKKRTQRHSLTVSEFIHDRIQQAKRDVAKSHPSAVDQHSVKRPHNTTIQEYCTDNLVVSELFSFI